MLLHAYVADPLVALAAVPDPLISFFGGGIHLHRQRTEFFVDHCLRHGWGEKQRVRTHVRPRDFISTQCFDDALRLSIQHGLRPKLKRASRAIGQYPLSHFHKLFGGPIEALALGELVENAVAHDAT